MMFFRNFQAGMGAMSARSLRLFWRAGEQAALGPTRD